MFHSDAQLHKELYVYLMLEGSLERDTETQVCSCCQQVLEEIATQELVPIICSSLGWHIVDIYPRSHVKKEES